MPGAKSMKLSAKRAAIVDALKRCMVTHGYADTNLSDIAREAGISVSHFLYYYPSKEAVLLELCSEILDKSAAEITACAGESPEERIHVLVDHLFERTPVALSDLGIVQELISLSMHRPALRRKLAQNHATMMAYLYDLFEKVPRQPDVTASDAATIAAALWQGLFTNSLYAKDLVVEEGRERQLYRRALFALANIQDAGAGKLAPNLLSQRTAEKASGRRPRSLGVLPTGLRTGKSSKGRGGS
jgi:AcrR family transcriptional regulator